MTLAHPPVFIEKRLNFGCFTWLENRKKRSLIGRIEVPEIAFIKFLLFPLSQFFFQKPSMRLSSCNSPLK